jgi:exopolyphosphatase/pppGpp-phosphohydrolase
VRVALYFVFGATVPTGTWIAIAVAAALAIQRLRASTWGAREELLGEPTSGDL